MTATAHPSFSEPVKTASADLVWNLSLSLGGVFRRQLRSFSGLPDRMSEKDSSSGFHLLNLFELPDDYVREKYSIDDVLQKSKKVNVKQMQAGSLALLQNLPWYIQAER